MENRTNIYESVFSTFLTEYCTVQEAPSNKLFKKITLNNYFYISRKVLENAQFNYRWVF